MLNSLRKSTQNQSTYKPFSTCWNGRELWKNLKIICVQALEIEHDVTATQLDDHQLCGFLRILILV